MTYKTFKQLVEQISRAETERELLQAQADVTASYQHDKINFKEGEMLLSLVFTGFRAYVVDYRLPDTI